MNKSSVPPATGQATHTPTPWHFSDLHGREIIHTLSGIPVASLKYGNYMRRRDEANADFIVRACNNHAALMTFVKRVADIGKNSYHNMPANEFTAIIEDARAVLEQAKG